MADLLVFTNGNNTLGFPGDGTVSISGTAHLPNSNYSNWIASFPMGALVATINTAIRDAAVDAINTEYGPNTTGELLDKITLIGGAVGL